MRTPINFKAWIEEHREQLRPPVGNQVIWNDSEFIVMVVGGPNIRKDYHVNQGEEFFHQLEGDITLKIVENGRAKDIIIREGEIFLLPPRVPHSPRRSSNTVGLVMERQRRPGELDCFLWFCGHCGAKLYEEFIVLKDIVKDLPPLFDRFYGDAKRTTCGGCGTIEHRP